MAQQTHTDQRPACTRTYSSHTPEHPPVHPHTCPPCIHRTLGVTVHAQPQPNTPLANVQQQNTIQHRCSAPAGIHQYQTHVYTCSNTEHLALRGSAGPKLTDFKNQGGTGMRTLGGPPSPCAMQSLLLYPRYPHAHARHRRMAPAAPVPAT